MDQLTLTALVADALSENQETAARASRALFRDWVEPLADAFDAEACSAYAREFSSVVARASGRWSGEELLGRYERVRRRRRFTANDATVRDVVVLSRVTLGADVAVTSVVLDAAKKRFPGARIYFAGPAKNFELFAADSRLRHLAAPYGRGALLRDRIGAGLALGEVLRPGALVIDPDSRLTQLGLLPVCEEANYFFWESRSYGGDGSETLPELARRWVAETFAVLDAHPFIAPGLQAPDTREDLVTVSFGVGENPAKRVSDPFEREVLRSLAERGLAVLVDEGAGGEESERVRRAVGQCASPSVRTFRGSFAAFAASIARSRMYLGYDSAGQHVAAASGVPLAVVFAGFANERMLSRWSPCGRGARRIIRASEPDALPRTLAAINRLLDLEAA